MAATSAPMPTAWLPCPGKTKAICSLTVLLRRRPLHPHLNHLAAAIHPAVGAGMVVHVELVALWAACERGELDLVVLAAVALPTVGETFLRKRAHGVYSLADRPPQSWGGVTWRTRSPSRPARPCCRSTSSRNGVARSHLH